MCDLPYLQARPLVKMNEVLPLTHVVNRHQDLIEKAVSDIVQMHGKKIVQILRDLAKWPEWVCEDGPKLPRDAD